MLAIDIDGDIYGWGKNHHRQLDNTTVDIVSPKYIDITTDVFKGVNWLSCAVGENVSAAVNRFGEIFVWGNFLSPNETTYLVDPIQLPINEKTTKKQFWIDVACGPDCLIALNSAGQIFAYGAISSTLNMVEALKIENFKQGSGTTGGIPVFTSVYAGGTVNYPTFYAIDNKGKAYVWNYVSFAKLVLANGVLRVNPTYIKSDTNFLLRNQTIAETVITPQDSSYSIYDFSIVPTGTKFLKISAGPTSAILLSSGVYPSGNSLYSFGPNYYGEIPSTYTDSRITPPRYMPVLRKIDNPNNISWVNCSAGLCHNYAISSSGALYGFGSVIGSSNKTLFDTIIRPIPSGSNNNKLIPISISSRKYQSISHLAYPDCLTEDGLKDGGVKDNNFKVSNTQYLSIQAFSIVGRSNPTIEPLYSSPSPLTLSISSSLPYISNTNNKTITLTFTFNKIANFTFDDIVRHEPEISISNFKSNINQNIFTVDVRANNTEDIDISWPLISKDSMIICPLDGAVLQ